MATLRGLACPLFLQKGSTHRQAVPRAGFATHRTSSLCPRAAARCSAVSCALPVRLFTSARAWMSARQTSATPAIVITTGGTGVKGPATQGRYGSGGVRGGAGGRTEPAAVCGAVQRGPARLADGVDGRAVKELGFDGVDVAPLCGLQEPCLPKPRDGGGFPHDGTVAVRRLGDHHGGVGTCLLAWLGCTKVLKPEVLRCARAIAIERRTDQLISSLSASLSDLNFAGNFVLCCGCGSRRAADPASEPRTHQR
jgi:hypothetical protein